MIALGFVVFGFLALLALFNSIVRAMKVRVALQQGRFNSRSLAGQLDLVLRSEQPQRFWRLLAGEGAISAVYLVAAGLLLWGIVHVARWM